jgi:hypothetical protein
MNPNLALVPCPKPTVLGIVGSYRKGGHIDTAVSAILASAATAGANTQKVYLQDQHIEFCTNCRHCLQNPWSEPLYSSGRHGRPARPSGGRRCPGVGCSG